jgi:hypothetical protein
MDFNTGPESSAASGEPTGPTGYLHTAVHRLLPLYQHTRRAADVV